jgi:twinkle protein
MDDDQKDDSPFVRHESCPECGSRNNLARYASGRGFCFGCSHWEPADDARASSTPRKPRVFDPIEGAYQNITAAYGIDMATCRALGIKIVQWSCKDDDGDPLPRKGCISFDYHNDRGSLWGQKIRYKISEEEKTYSFPHADGKPPLWLMHRWGKGSDTRSLVIFEGEGDAAAYYQYTQGKYPVVSLPTGAKGAEDVLRHWYQWLDRFDKIVLIFDGDETGREWAQRAAAILPPGKAHIGEVPGHKDARTALMAGDGRSIQSAFFNAEKFVPQGIFRVSDLVAEARKPVVQGLPWFLETLTKFTFGRRWGELYVLGAGNSIGKTDWTTQSISYDALVLGIMTAVIYLEQPPVETLKRLAGKIAGKPFHIPAEDLPPDQTYTQAELDAALDRLEETPNLIFAGNFESTAWADVEKKIRYLAVSEGVKIVYLDNMTALVDETNERASVEGIIKKMALLCQELGIIIVLLCHLATPDGKPHEEGGQVSLRHFKGSRAMGAFPHYAFGLERNTQHPKPEMRHYTTLRVVKDRYTGRYNGATMCLRFDVPSGQLIESDFPVDDEDNEDRVHGFKPYAPVDDDVPF